MSNKSGQTKRVQGVGRKRIVNSYDTVQRFIAGYWIKSINNLALPTSNDTNYVVCVKLM